MLNQPCHLSCSNQIKTAATLIAVLMVSNLAATQSQAEVYRYQDNHGNWHFTDKKPKQASETLNLNAKATSKSSANTPYLQSDTVQGGHTLNIENPLPAPIHCLVMDKDQNPLFAIVEAYSSAPAITSTNNSNLHAGPYDLRLFTLDCIIGRPDSQTTAYNYAPPFTDYKPMEVTQGFHGSFSHSQPPHLYAIDIAMPIGTKITASRAGVVIARKNDYAYAGTNSAFFYDKANYVQVYHEDGSHATYAHMLMGKVMVKIGDTVEKGQLLGLSGNSGFSTGPHLHFVIQHNKQGRLKSLPFAFDQNEEKPVEPKKGMWLIQSQNK